MFVARSFVRTFGLVEGKDPLPIVLHINHGPPVHCCGVQRHIEFAEMRMAVVGVFAFRISMMHDQAKARATGAERCPLQHFEIAVGVAEGGNRDDDRYAR